jgi:hypothetical protein
MVFAGAVLAQPGQTEVCPSYDGKYELGGGWEGSPVAGITISNASDGQVTVTVAAGFTLSRYCYKTGSGGGGATSLEAPVVGPASFTINKTNTGGGISHITFDTSVTPPPVPVTDLCLNIAGDQETVPAGMVRDANGNCATPVVVTTDLCLNIAGDQETVPAGMVRDVNGNCAAPPAVVITDLCPNIAGNQEAVPAGMMKDGEGACVTPNPGVFAPPVVTPPPATPVTVVTPAPPVGVAQVAAKPVSGRLGVSKTVVTNPARAKAKAKQVKVVKAKHAQVVKSKKVKVVQAKVVKAKAVNAKAVKAKVMRIHALPFTP